MGDDRRPWPGHGMSMSSLAVQVRGAEISEAPHQEVPGCNERKQVYTEPHICRWVVQQQVATGADMKFPGRIQVPPGHIQLHESEGEPGEIVETDGRRRHDRHLQRIEDCGPYPCAR